MATAMRERRLNGSTQRRPQRLKRRNRPLRFGGSMGLRRQRLRGWNARHAMLW
jgi:hypothetical protein